MRYHMFISKNLIISSVSLLTVKPLNKLYVFFYLAVLDPQCMDLPLI